MKKALNTTKRRLFAWGTALAMCVNLLQITAFAADENPVEEPSDAIGATTVVDITEQVWGEETKPEPVTEEKTETVENEDGTTTETVTTTETMDSEDGNKHSEITNVTTTATDAEGNPISGTENVTGSATSKEETDSVETTEQIPVGSEVGDITTTAPSEGETTESSVTVDAAEALKPDVSGEEWTQNEDGSSVKTEDIENGNRVTTVSQGKDEKGNVVYTTKTVTTTTITEPVVMESPEEGIVENEDGTRTVTKVDVDENGNVIGYTQVTETLNSEGVVTSSVTKSVRNEEGQASVTTTVENTKTQTVDPDAKTEVKVTMGAVTSGEFQGALDTRGLEIVDKPTSGNGLITPDGKDVAVNLDDLKDDDLIFVSGYGLTSKYNLIVMYTQNKNGGWSKYTKGWPVQQYIVKDKDGNEHPVYCADMSVPTDNGTTYYLDNTTDADYYTNPNNNQIDPTGGEHLREIAINGYWGTAEGTGSLSELMDKLLTAKAEGNPALETLTDDQIKSMTAGQALAATQAAIWKYGNSLNLNPYAINGGTISHTSSENSKLEYDEKTGVITRVTTTYDKETGKTTITTEETKVNLPDGEEVKVERNPETGEITKISVPKYYPAYLKLLPDGWLNNPMHSLVAGYSKNSDDTQIIEAVYKYLTTLEEKENKTTDLIKPDDIVEAVTTVKEAIGKDEQERDVYEADVSFVLTVEPDRMNGDLLVKVYDSETGEVLATRRVAGDGTNDDSSITAATAVKGEKGTTYTINGLKLANGQKVNVNLVGSQEVKKGAYLITAMNGQKEAQTFVGVEEGTRQVDLNFTLQLDVTAAEAQTVENTVTKIEGNVNAAQNVTYNYYTLELPDPEDPTPEDPTPEYPTPDAPDPDPDPDEPTVEIPDEPTPLADIPDDPVPLMEQPQDDLIDIFDDDVPLTGGLPTGNGDSVWYLFAVFSLAGLGFIKLLEKKSEAK